MILGQMSMSWSASPILRKKYQSLPVHTVRSDLLRDMVKTLQDCCLACIARHISSYNRLGTFLSRLHKESLLERMCWHGQLTPERSPSVSYHLFSHVLKRVNLSYSTQVDDKTFDVLARSDCLPTSITVKDCPNVTGMRWVKCQGFQRRSCGTSCRLNKTMRILKNSGGEFEQVPSAYQTVDSSSRALFRYPPAVEWCLKR